MPGMYSIYYFVSQERNSFESGSLCLGRQNLKGLVQSVKPVHMLTAFFFAVLALEIALAH